MSFIRKKRDIFANDSIWKNQGKSSLSFERNSTSVNTTPVQQQYSSCFQHGLPPLNMIGPSDQKEIKQERSDLKFCHVTTIHQDIGEEDTKEPAVKLQEDEQSYQYDLLFNQKINKEKSVTQNCFCCPPLVSKSSREIQHQNDFIITTKGEDLSDLSYIRPISIKLEKPSSDNIEATRKTAPLIHPYPLKDVNNNSVSNKLAGGRLNESNNLSTPKEKNIRSNNDDFVFIKPERLDEPSDVTKLVDKTVRSISLNLNKPVVGLKEEQSEVPILEEKTIRPVNPLTNNNDSDRLARNATISTDAMVKPGLNEQSDFKSKSQSSILTVEKVQSILEFHHSTSEERKTQENDCYHSDDEVEPLDDIDFFDISNVRLFKCSQCDKEFHDKNSMRHHVTNDHKCTICNKVIYHARHMELHLEKVHGNYTMRNKSKRSSRQSNGNRNPNTARNYFCCGQNFKSGRELGIHKNTHKYYKYKRNLPY